MVESEFISTGEAARRIGVSRSTLIRKFDAGEIRGRINPVTGVRQVLASSLADFMRARGLPSGILSLELRRIVLAAQTPSFRSDVRDICSRDDRLGLCTVSRGADALAVCSRLRPDLFIVGSDLQDVACSDVVASLRRQADLRAMKILCYASKMRACSCDGSDADISVDGVTQESAQALRSRIYRLLGLDLPTEDGAGRPHRRKWPRVNIEVPVRVGAYRAGMQAKEPWGRGIMRNVSMGGAFVSDLRFEEGLPGGPFRMVLRADTGILPDWQAYCHVVRLGSNGTLSAGLQFVRMSKPARERLHQIAR